MERIRVPAGTAQKFESVFKKLQDAIQKNQFNRIDIFVKAYGAVVDVNNNVPQDNSWKIQVLDTNNREIQVMTTGSSTIGLSKGDHYIKLPAPATMTVAPGTGGSDGDDAFNVIYAEHRDQYADNVPVVDGFVYDSSGNVAQQATSIKDNTVLIQNLYNTFDQAWSAALTPATSRVALAIIKVIRVSGNYQIDLTWTDTNSNPNREITDGVCDLRNINRLLLNENLLDDSKILFKDRDSLKQYSRSVGGAVTFDKRIHFNDYITATTGTRLAIGGPTHLAAETITTAKMSTFPAISIGGSTRLDSSLWIQSQSTSIGTAPQIRLSSNAGSASHTMIIEHGGSGGLYIAPQNTEGAVELADKTKGLYFTQDGSEIHSLRTTKLGIRSLSDGETYETWMYKNARVQNSLNVGSRAIIGTTSSGWFNDDLALPDTYDTLVVANPDATLTERASILISQAAKGPGNRSALKFQVTDTSSNTFRSYLRMDISGVNEPILDIGSINTSTNADTRYARFDSSGNLSIEKNLNAKGTLAVTGTSTFFNTALFTANQITEDQVAIG